MSSQRIINNTFINILNTGVGFILAYAMTPIILHRLGTTNYGLWVFLSIFSVSGYFSLLDLGFQGAAIKYVAEFAATNQRERLAGIINASISFFSIAGLVGGLLLWLFNIWFLPAVFHLPASQLHLTQTLVSIMAIGFLVQFPAIAFSAVLEGLQRYDVLRGISVLLTIFSNVAIWLWLTAGNGLPFLVGNLFLTGLITAVAYGWAVRRLMPTITWRPWHIETQVWRLLFALSGKLFASKIVGLIFNNTDKIMIGIFLTVSQQTDYDIVNKLHVILLSLLSIVNQAILPAASELAAKADRQGLRSLVLRATKYSAAMVFPLFLFFLLMPRAAIVMWVGPTFAHLAPLVVLYCSHFVVTMFVGVSSTMLVGMNQVGRVLKISVWAAVMNFVISLTTVHWLGIQGLLLGTAVAYFISSWLYILAADRLFELPGRMFFNQTVRPLLIAASASIAVVLVARWLVPNPSLIGGLAIVAISYFGFGGFLARWGISKEEWATLRQWFDRRRSSQSTV